MTKIHKEIKVDAPVHQVFAFMADPERLLEIWPSMIEVEDLKPLPTGGVDYNWQYKMAGMKFRGKSHTTEFVEDQRHVVETKGGIDSKFIWEYSPEKDGTRVSLTTDYEVPKDLLGRLAKPFILKQNEREAETILSNLKSRLEA